jgi:hypothetical protein
MKWDKPYSGAQVRTRACFARRLYDVGKADGD